MTTTVTTPERVGSALVAIGERLGFYKIMSETPVTGAELAARTGAPGRLVRDWLAVQVRQGYLTCEASTGRYANSCSLPASARANG
jgi:hypothetical protein